ncbi:uncharacterized protein A4U43_C02F16890 [Asparagus officinalis]|uniref:Uncharacterized protein n=1 Tax=Asparagus officinalis TaxID=4686 RepID=A0A5P1FKP8_ASPOF|nr:uncharacterized protein A4U43_C02F16890 [Asparagus officinalis]
MASFLLVSRSISFIVISVGGIFLSIVVAFLFVSYNPTGSNPGTNGYFVGVGNSSQTSLDSINGDQPEFSNKLPEFSEQAHEVVGDEQFSFGAEVPDSNGSRSVNDIKGANVSASSEFIDDSMKNGSETAGYIGAQVPAFAPELSVDASTSIGQGNISISSVPVNGSAKNDSGIVSYIGAEVPAIAPTLSLDADSHVSVNVRDSKEPNVSISSALDDDSGKNDSGIGGSTVDSLHQTGSVAALPPPPSKVSKKTKLSE